MNTLNQTRCKLRNIVHARAKLGGRELLQSPSDAPEASLITWLVPGLTSALPRFKLSLVIFKTMLCCLQLEDSQEDAASLAVDDEVEFTLVHDLKWNTCMPRGLRLLCRAAERRELGKVRLEHTK